MKKILTLLLALTMCLYLININSNSINAEDEGTSNAVLINNNDDLVDFLIHPTNTEAVLNKSITYDYNFIKMGGVDVTLLCDKTLDLNGYDLITDCTLSFRLKTGTTSSLTVKIKNSGSKTSAIKATEDMLIAMVQTKMSDDITDPSLIKTTGQLTLDIDGGNKGIVFDGSGHNENLTDFAGVSVGYHSSLATYTDQPSNKLNINNVTFRNIHPDYVKTNAIGIGVLNYGGIVTIDNSVFENCTIGVAAGLISTGKISGTQSVDIKNSTFKNNYVGIGNGDIIDELIYIAPEKITIDDCVITDNNYGLSYVGSAPQNDGTDFIVNSSNSKTKINNTIDFYAENIGSGPIYELNGLYPDDEYVFAVPKNTSIDDLGTLVAKTNNGLFGNTSVVSVDKETDKTNDKEYMISASGASSCQGEYKYYINQRKDGAGIIENDNISITKGSKVTLKYKLEEDENDMVLYSLYGPNNEIIACDEESKGGYLYMSFIPTISGDYLINRLETDDATSTLQTTNSNKITIILSDPPSPSPSKKDESCEKVIGPTWHWNNKKGICEDSGSVKTYSR